MPIAIIHLAGADLYGKGYDFRYETAVADAKILNDKEKIKEVVQSGEMPYLGTTMVDQEGLDLIVAYLNSL